MSEKRSQSDAYLAARNHWASKKPKVDDEKKIPQPKAGSSNDPIEIGDDSEEEPTGKPVPLKSAVRLLQDRSHELHDGTASAEANKEALTLLDLIGMPDLSKTYQFNFAVDLDVFLTHLHRDAVRRRAKIVFVTGSDVVQNSDDAEFVKKAFDIEEVKANLPYRFGSHHSKMMVNFFQDNTVEFVIMTCNFNKIDFAGLTQMCWRSGRLSRKKDTSNSTVLGDRFLQDMTQYLRSYNKVTISQLIDDIKLYDYLNIDIEILLSSPGIYNLNQGPQQGYGKFLQLLKRNDLLLGDSDANHNVLAQVSSIASSFKVQKGQHASVFTHLICPLMFSKTNRFSSIGPSENSARNHQTQYNYTPNIVYPTLDEVADSNLGYMSGVAIHFNNTNARLNANYLQNIKPYLCKWNSSSKNSKTGRENVMPHTKIYACDNADNWSSLRWALVGSHNLSKQAWGEPLANNEYRICSYELSIFVHQKENRKLIPVYASDSLQNDTHNIPIRLPFTLPPRRYLAQDRPWSASTASSRRDRFGNTN